MPTFPTGWLFTLTPLLRGAALFAALALFGASALLAEDGPNWSRAAALEAAAPGASRQQVESWLHRIDAGQAGQLLMQLRQATDTGSPAFEARLHLLAQALAETPLDEDNDRLLSWLASYRPQVRVAHEEFAAYGVPLFPVDAAARGSVAERQRRAARSQAETLIADPARWIAGYLAANPVERQGLEQGLREAGAGRLAPLASTLADELADELAGALTHALADAPAGKLPGKLSAHAELATPAGIVASQLQDAGLFFLAFRYSQGASTAQLLREAGWRLDLAQRSHLFGQILELEAPEAAPDKVALGISLLAPGLTGNTEVSERLLQLLDHPQFGAAAALALAGHPDSTVQASLRSKLEQNDLAGRRAALALGLPVIDEGDSRPDTRESQLHPPGDSP